MSNRIDDLRTPTKRARGLGSAKDGVHHFIWQRVTAVTIGLCALWLLGVLLTLRSADYSIIHGLVADPINASVLVLFLIAMFWHARLGVQVVIEDYVHGKHAKIALLLVSSFIHVLIAATAVLAVLRIAMRSVG